MTTDIHCHILYGVDDGASSIEESVEMLNAARAAGIDRIVATPHLRRQYNDIKLMKTRYDELKGVASDAGIDLLMGYEVNCLTLADFDQKDYRKFCIEGTDALLLEFDFAGMPAFADSIIYSLQRDGIIVIIAHPERYADISSDFDKAYHLYEMGCEFQVDAWSLMLSKLSSSRRTAEKMLSEGMVSFIGSDAHESKNFVNFSKAQKKYGALCRHTGVKAFK